MGCDILDQYVSFVYRSNSIDELLLLRLKIELVLVLPLALFFKLQYCITFEEYESPNYENGVYLNKMVTYTVCY